MSTSRSLKKRLTLKRSAKSRSRSAEYKRGGDASVLRQSRRGDDSLPRKVSIDTSHLFKYVEMDRARRAGLRRARRGHLTIRLPNKGRSTTAPLERTSADGSKKAEQHLAWGTSEAVMVQDYSPAGGTTFFDYADFYDVRGTCFNMRNLLQRRQELLLNSPDSSSCSSSGHSPADKSTLINMGSQTPQFQIPRIIVTCHDNGEEEMS